MNSWREVQRSDLIVVYVKVHVTLWNTYRPCFLEIFLILFEYTVRACSMSFVNATNFSLLVFFCSSVSRGRILLNFWEVVITMGSIGKGGDDCEASQSEEALLFLKNKKVHATFQLVSTKELK